MQVDVKNISKYYGDFCAVDNISFSFHSGEIFSVLGRNGSGKTSTIRMMLGTLEKSEGDVLFDGKNMNEMMYNIGYLAEERGLYERDSIEKQLIHFATLKGMNKKKAKENTHYWLERIGLADRKNEKLGNLSKGNQQKIQIINTLIHDPEIIIFDEPFSGLDPVNASFFIDLLHELKEKNKCIMVSSHQLHLLDDLVEKILIINNSKQVYYGNANDLKQQYSREYMVMTIGDVDEMDKETISKIFNTEIQGNRLIVNISENCSVQDVFRYLLEKEIAVVSLEMKKQTLYDIFVEMVGDKSEKL